jgi:uncharacterized membrane protein
MDSRTCFGSAGTMTTKSTRPNPGTTGPDRLTIAATVGAAVNAGVFFSWSAMVMPAIGDLPTTEAVAAMQELNAAAPAPFTVVGFGTAALCLAVMVRAFGVLGTARGRWMLGGATLFLLAGLVITFVVNVPLSYSIDQIALTESADAEWNDLYTSWVWANHARTLGSAAAAAALAVAANSAQQDFPDRASALT